MSSHIPASMRAAVRADALAHFKRNPSPANAVRLAISEYESRAGSDRLLDAQVLDALEHAAALCSDAAARGRGLKLCARMLRRIAGTIEEASR